MLTLCGDCSTVPNYDHKTPVLNNCEAVVEIFRDADFDEFTSASSCITYPSHCTKVIESHIESFCAIALVGWG